MFGKEDLRLQLGVDPRGLGVLNARGTLILRRSRADRQLIAGGFKNTNKNGHFRPFEPVAAEPRAPPVNALHRPALSAHAALFRIIVSTA